MNSMGFPSLELTARLSPSASLIFAPPTLIMTSFTRIPAAYAGLCELSGMPTTSTPSVKNLTPKTIPPGISFISSDSALAEAGSALSVT